MIRGRSMPFAVAVFGLTILLAIGLGTFALVKLHRTDKQVKEIAQRVILIEQPSKQERQAGLKRAVRELRPAEAQALFDRLLKSSTPEQKRRLAAIAREQRKEAARRKRGSPSQTPSGAG